MNGSPYADAGMVAGYDRLAVPLQFAEPARDLVASLDLSIGNCVLDVGCGTGAALVQAAACVGGSGIAVGVDASIEMLRTLRRRGAGSIAAARASNLPFPEHCFDVVFASFVLSHFQNYQRSLMEMVRVLRPQGRIGVTAWGGTPNRAGMAWKEVAIEFAKPEELQAAFEKVIPWDEWFSQASHVRRALEDAKLTEIKIARREYVIRTTVTEFLSAKEASVEGTLLRQRLSSDKWNVFRRNVEDAFRRRFGDVVEYTRDVNVGVATKPPA